MKLKTFTFKDREGLDIFVYKWSPDTFKSAKAVVQIAHGMAEHAKRYEEFAEYLVNNGYVVYANDHRGHGRTAGSPERIGYFADKDGWNLVVDAMHDLTKIIKRDYKELPVFLLGHSMGSWFARNYIFLYGSELKGVILSGMIVDPGMLANMGIAIAKWEIRKKGRKAKSYVMNNMSFGNYNKSFKPVRTKFDWLSRDEKEVDKNINDPFCGIVFTASFFYDLFTGLKQIRLRENIEKTPKDLPVYMFSGADDPVGKKTKGVMQLYKIYKKAGIKDISYKFYEHGRHEMLNEINRQEVYEDTINWMNRCL